jgi:hypothetical protein
VILEMRHTPLCRRSRGRVIGDARSHFAGIDFKCIEARQLWSIHVRFIAALHTLPTTQISWVFRICPNKRIEENGRAAGLLREV